MTSKDDEAHEEDDRNADREKRDSIRSHPFQEPADG
jgi:hypothetical protein